MAPRKLNDDLTPEQERLLGELARRQHEEEAAEARVFERYGKRAEFAKQLWAAIIGLVVFVVLATGYVIKMQTDAAQLRADHDRLAREVERNRTDIQSNRTDITKLNYEKQDKPR